MTMRPCSLCSSKGSSKQREQKRAEIIDPEAELKPLLGFFSAPAEDTRVVDQRIETVVFCRKRRGKGADAVQVGKVEPA